MPETVGQHGVATFTSPVNGTTPIDANTVRGNDNTIRTAYVDHDSDPGIHVQSSALASRPVAGTAGRKWMTVDGTVTRFWIDTGSTWLEVQASAFSTARTLWGQSFDGTANVSGNLSSVGDIAMTGALSGATSLSATNLTGTLQTAAQPNVTSVGTLSSLTVSGNVTVDTNTLFVDATNNRVGIGTTSPIGSVDSISNATAAFVARASTTGANQTTDVLTVYNADASLFALARYNATQHIWRYAGTTEGMRLDASGNLGLGVTPSAWASGWSAFEQPNGAFVSNAGATHYITQNAYYNGTNWIYRTSLQASFYSQALGAHSWHTAPSGTAGNTISFTQAMTLDASGRLLINDTNPRTGNRLLVNDANGYLSYGAPSAGFGRLQYEGGPGNVFYIDVLNSSGAIAFRTENSGLAERARIDASGNFGLGVTPSAWSSTYRFIDIGSGGSAAFGTVGGTADTTNNAYHNGTSWLYKATAAATLYRQQSGIHYWFTAPSGTAGNAITFTQAMTLDASGRLLVGTTSGTEQVSVVSSDIYQLSIKNASASSLSAFGHDSTNNLRFYVNGSERARITSGGKFGVGAYGTISYLAEFLETSGADRDILLAGVSGATNGLTVKWNHASSKTYVNIANIPTSSAGLPAGTLWSDSGTIKIA